MKLFLTGAAALALFSSAPARAQTTDHESAIGAAHEALGEQAEAPRVKPALPDDASARAAAVSHGKQGAAMKAKHAHKGDAEKTRDTDDGKKVRDTDDGKRVRDTDDGKKADDADKDAAKHAESAEDAAGDDAANRSAKGAAASAAKAANADSHGAAGQARGVDKRGGSAPGSSGNGGNGGNGHGHGH